MAAAAARLCSTLASGALLAIAADSPPSSAKPLEPREGKITLLWPIHLLSIPLASPMSNSLEPVEFGRELAQLGLEGFNRYVKENLPTELEKSERIKSEFYRVDHSRVNFAFKRWQARAHFEHFGDVFDMEELEPRGDVAPRLDGLNYAWPELHNSTAFLRLSSRLMEASKLYLQRSGVEAAKGLRPFIWVEVFQAGDAMSPMTRMDRSLATGRFFASTKKNALKMNFEDPRGINPPYGKTFSHAPFEGNLVIFPPWSSNFITPNMEKETAVCFSFVLLPPKGTLHDWKEDPTSSITSTRPYPPQVKKQKKG